MNTEGCRFRHDRPIPQDLAAAHPKVLHCLNYWQGLKPASGGLPGRRDLNPMAIPDLLPHLWLLDVKRQPKRYRYRLVGGALVDAGLGAKRGDYFDEKVRSQDLPALLAVLDQVSDQGMVDWRRGPPSIDHDRFIARLERVLLPLSSDGESIDVILGCTVFYWSDGRID